jgi:ribosomal protein L20A (L18A)
MPVVFWVQIPLTLFMTTLKQQVYGYFRQAMEEKVQLLRRMMADLKESAANETKSTAGDKHETALAMLQIEQANVGAQLHEALNQKNALEKINPDISANHVVNGSLVKTNKGYFFLGIALGKAVVGETVVFAISPQSPLGSKLMGLKTGDAAEINKNTYTIEAIG